MDGLKILKVVGTDTILVENPFCKDYFFTESHLDAYEEDKVDNVRSMLDGLFKGLAIKHWPEDCLEVVKEVNMHQEEAKPYYGVIIDFIKQNLKTYKGIVRTTKDRLKMYEETLSSIEKLLEWKIT